MNDGLIDAFSHNTWATRQVIQLCEGLSDEELETSVPGTYGSIIATFRHYIRSEAGYFRRLTGEEAEWLRVEDKPNLVELKARNEEMGERWNRFLSEPFDAERMHVIAWHDGIDRDVPAGVVLAQAIHHGSDHRSQICTTLSTMGIEIPEMGLWDYAEDTNRAPQRV